MKKIKGRWLGVITVIFLYISIFFFGILMNYLVFNTGTFGNWQQCMNSSRSESVCGTFPGYQSFFPIKQFADILEHNVLSGDYVAFVIPIIGYYFGFYINLILLLMVGYGIGRYMENKNQL